MRGSAAPSKKLSRAALKSGASGSAAWNRVIDERNLTASMPPKIVSRRLTGVAEHQRHAFAQPRAEQRMGEIGPRLRPIGEGVADRHGAVPQPGDLGKDEPHPVAPLRPGAQFGEHLRPDPVLRGDEAFEP